MKFVQELLGHAAIEMTNRYSHLSPEVPITKEVALRADGVPGREEALESLVEILPHAERNLASRALDLQSNDILTIPDNTPDNTAAQVAFPGSRVRDNKTLTTARRRELFPVAGRPGCR